MLPPEIFPLILIGGFPSVEIHCAPMLDNASNRGCIGLFRRLESPVKMISLENRLAIPEAILIVVPEFSALISGTSVPNLIGFLTIIEEFLISISAVFENAWELARKTNYWEAMIINGLATASILNSDPKIITKLIEKGALGASVSGNGPAVAAITKKENEADIKKVFATLEGSVIVSKVSNKKAEVHEL